jgi:hypothetical protein
MGLEVRRKRACTRSRWRDRNAGLCWYPCQIMHHIAPGRRLRYETATTAVLDNPPLLQLKNEALGALTAVLNSAGVIGSLSWQRPPFKASSAWRHIPCT